MRYDLLPSRSAFPRAARGVLLFLLAAPLLTLPASARKQSKEERKAEEEAVAKLSEDARRWLQEVAFLISDEEKKTFLALEKDYQRDAFIERFWKVRDNIKRTARNEFREDYEARIQSARENFGAVDDDRARVLLTNGFPVERFTLNRCGSSFWPLEVWYYAGTERTGMEFLLLFYKKGGGRYTLWDPVLGTDQLLVFGGPFPDIMDACGFEQGEILIAALASLSQSHGGELGATVFLRKVVESPEHPEPEWVATFSTYSTDLPEGAETFDARFEVDYPGRHTSRTVTQGAVLVPVEHLALDQMANFRAYHLMLAGEVLLGDELFENFRYKYDFPEGEIEGDEIPLVFQRYLRPGEYRLVVKVEDVVGGHFYRGERAITVPKLDEEPRAEPADPKTARLFAEANAAILSGENTVKIIPPRAEWLTGLLRIDSFTTGPDIAKVTFFLDNTPVLTKNKPPYNVELDLGPAPQARVLRVEAYDAEGEELAADELMLNAGRHRFAARLVEPRRDKTYRRSIRAQADVIAPQGDIVERVEFYLNETLVATVYQPPYIQPIVLQEDGQIAYVRAVAYRTDGSFTEDLVFINSPNYLEEVDVDLVELYTTVLDKEDHPVEGLGRERFTVFEDGVQQTLARFDLVRNLPIHAAVMLDISASMNEEIDDTKAAALHFFEQAVTPKDRAAIITFNDHPNLAAEFTNDVDELAAGLSGLKAERGTALYDSLIFALYYFNGIRGQRAILLLSDGKDESSRFDFDDAMDFAHRAGVAIYSIGLQLDKKHFEARRKLTRISEETGGRSFFIEDVAELEAIYDTIQRELRSRYLLTYQSSNTGSSREFRSIEVKVEGSGLEAKTLRGYYP